MLVVGLNKVYLAEGVVAESLGPYSNPPVELLRILDLAIS
jgi:hypothetical protein